MIFYIKPPEMAAFLLPKRHGAAKKFLLILDCFSIFAALLQYHHIRLR